jgi:membrane protease YdiL (CAAX protease family)
VAALDRVVVPIALFVFFYVATFIALAWLRFPFNQWAGLISVSVATAASIAILDRGGWPLGLFVPPRLAVPEFLFGSAFGAVLVGTCAVLVVLTTDVRHESGAGFPWREVLLVYIPAAVHEELLFRGYPFQKLHRWHRRFAIVFVALVFAALHMGNAAVSWLGLTNIFLGGILLGLAYERYGRLWFPIGLHLAWNVMSGPILGHEVSGYDSMATVFVERGHGPGWLTGGEFGIEGSVWMTVIEIAGVVLLWKTVSKSQSLKVSKNVQSPSLRL